MQKKIRLFMRRYWLFGMAGCLVFFVSIINVFPNGFTFSGGDVEQYFNLDYAIKNFGYTWSNLLGEGFFLQYFSYNLYYFPIYLASSFFKVSLSQQSFFYFFIFLFFSFCSFYFALSFFTKDKIEKVNFKYKILFSLVYTFNTYTFYNFYYTWGYSPFLFLYVLIPVMFGATYQFFGELTKKIDYKNLSILGMFFFLSNIANGNMPFFISLNILLFLFIAGLFVIKNGKSNIFLFLRKTLTYYFVYLLAIFWSVIPQIPEMFRQLNIYSQNEGVFDLKKWLLWQSVKFSNIFFISSGTKEFIKDMGFLGYLSLGVFLMLFISILLNKRKKKSLLLFIFLLVCCIFLMNKGRGIFDDSFVWMIFSNPILSSIRSFDKTFIFLPFFVILVIFLNFKGIFDRYKYVLIAFLVLNLFSVYPFFTGEIQTKYSTAFKSGENYLNAEYSYIHKIPIEYFSSANKLNKSILDKKILRVPYNVLNSTGWINYPKWNVVGADPTKQLFDYPSVYMNSVGSFGIWNYGKIWNEQGNEESKWILPVASLLNVKYVIYHKDVADKFIAQTIGKIRYYEENNLIIKIEDNDYFNVYRINIKLLQHLYTAQNFIVSQRTVEDLPEIVSSPDWQTHSVVFFRGQNKGKETALESIKSQSPTGANTPVLEFKKINPTKYRVRVHGASGVFPLVFSESFHDGWKAYLNQNVNLKNKNDNSKLKIDNYKILDGNTEDQVAKEELWDFVDSGYVTTLGDGKEKKIEHKKWDGLKEKLNYVEKYQIDFVSKNFQGTIQNDNLPNGNIFETWLKKPLDNSNHLMANGYANSWVIDTNFICNPAPSSPQPSPRIGEGVRCIQNPDGSYDFEIIVEFWPQRLFYVGLFISGTTLLACLGYLGYAFYDRRKNAEIFNEN
jgi:hypothetical protein